MLDISALIQAVLANGAVVGIAAWLGKLWGDRRIESIKAEHARKLEETKGDQTRAIETLKTDLSTITESIKAEHARKLEETRGEQARAIEALKTDLANFAREFQTGLDKKMMIFKTHFDLEFQSYRDLWALCDESFNIAAQTLTYYQLVAVDEESSREEKADSIKRYDTCRLALDAARKQRPFIAKEIADSVTDLLRECLIIAKTYKDVYDAMNSQEAYSFDRKPLIESTKSDLETVRDIYDETARLIATRISRMYVADFGDA